VILTWGVQRSSQHPMYFLDFHCCLYSVINSGRYGRDLVALRALRYGQLHRPFCFYVTLGFLGLDAVGYHYLLVPVIVSSNNQYLSHAYKKCWLKLLLCTVQLKDDKNREHDTSLSQNPEAISRFTSVGVAHGCQRCKREMHPVRLSPTVMNHKVCMLTIRNSVSRSLGFSRGWSVSTLQRPSHHQCSFSQVRD